MAVSGIATSIIKVLIAVVICSGPPNAHQQFEPTAADAATKWSIVQLSPRTLVGDR